MFIKRNLDNGKCAYLDYLILGNFNLYFKCFFLMNGKKEVGKCLCISLT
jgi:hypothetical protein